jgi:adenylate kinase
MALPMIITVIGPPGSGKGTQGALIAQKYDLNYIVAGNLVRALYKMQTPLGEKVRVNYNKGIPQPDEIITEAFKEEMSKMDMKKGFLLDSYPLSMGQAKALNEILVSYNLPENFVVYLDVSADSVVGRIKTRLICSKCSAVFLPADAAFSAKKCDKCGGDLMERADDKPEVVRRRIEEYKSRMADLKEYYQKKNRLIIINGEPSIEEIHRDVVRKIEEFVKQ